MALLPSGTTRIVASGSAVTTQKHPTNGRKISVASWNLISARWTTVLLMLISGTQIWSSGHWVIGSLGHWVIESLGHRVIALSCIGVDERRDLEIVGRGDVCRSHALRQRSCGECIPGVGARPEIRDPDLVANFATGVKQEARWNRQRQHLRVQLLVGPLVRLERE